MAFWDDAFSVPGTSASITLRLTVNVSSQSIPNNTTTLSWSLKMIKGTAGNPSRAFNDCDAAVAVNGSVYSASNLNYSFPSGAHTITVASGTRVVAHNADGTKSISVSGSYNGYSPIGSAAITTKTMVLPAIPRATIPTFTPNPIDFGQLLTINLDPAIGTYTHDVTYELGSASGSIASGVGSGDQTWTVPLSLMSEIPNSPSGTIAIIVKTYDGATLRGTTTTNLTANVPSTVVPTISSITDSETVSAVNTLIGKYVQGKSKLLLGLTGAAGVYGSTIVSSKITVDGQTINASSGTMADAFVGSGTLTITATVTDSRGRIGTLTKNISVLAYSPPSIATATAQRSDNLGVVDAENGTYARIDLNASVSSLLNGATQKNALRYRLSSRAPGSPTWIVKAGPTAPGGLTYNNHFQTSGFPVTNAYEILIEVLDVFDAVAAIQRSMPVGAVFMHWDASAGVGLGKYRQNGMLDVKGQIYQNNGKRVLDADDLLTAYRLLDIVYFASSGTFSKASYPTARAIRVRMVGAGGSGGGAVTAAAGLSSMGAGGGAGAYIEAIIPITSLGASETVTVGAGGAQSLTTGNAGGNTSLGTLAVCGGGTGGGARSANATAAGNTSPGIGGDPITVPSGGLGISGSDGGSVWGTNGLGISGQGGSSMLSGTARSNATSSSGQRIVGETGKTYGGGGGGAINSGSAAATNSGPGAPGIVIVEVLA